MQQVGSHGARVVVRERHVAKLFALGGRGFRALDLIAERPHDNAWVVAIPPHHVAHVDRLKLTCTRLVRMSGTVLRCIV